MLSLFKNMFGKPTDFKGIYENGALILDVRSPREFSTGHIKGAINIPVGDLKLHIAELKKTNKAIIACCQSGGRSEVARITLGTAGLEVYNGGSWNGLERKIQ